MIKQVFQINNKDSEAEKCIEVDKSNHTIKLLKNEKMYKADYLHYFNEGNQLLFDKVISDSIPLLFEGTSTLIIIYGEPATKKRLTLFSLNNNEGLLEKTIKKIFELNKNYKYFIKISFAEIKYKIINDLINQKTNLNKIEDIEEVDANNEETSIKNINEAINRITKCKNSMNCFCGREFDLVNFSLVNEKGLLSKVTFLRTTGHENIAKTCTIDKNTLKDLTYINSSLDAVKDTLNKFKKGKNSQFSKDSIISKYLSEEIKGKNLILIGNIQEDKKYEKDTSQTLNFIE